MEMDLSQEIGQSLLLICGIYDKIFDPYGCGLPSNIGQQLGNNYCQQDFYCANANTTNARDISDMVTNYVRDESPYMEHMANNQRDYNMNDGQEGTHNQNNEKTVIDCQRAIWFTVDKNGAFTTPNDIDDSNQMSTGRNSLYCGSFVINSDSNICGITNSNTSTDVLPIKRKKFSMEHKSAADQINDKWDLYKVAFREAELQSDLCGKKRKSKRGFPAQNSVGNTCKMDDHQRPQFCNKENVVDHQYLGEYQRLDNVMDMQQLNDCFTNGDCLVQEKCKSDKKDKKNAAKERVYKNKNSEIGAPVKRRRKAGSVKDNSHAGRDQIYRAGHFLPIIDADFSPSSQMRNFHTEITGRGDGLVARPTATTDTELDKSIRSNDSYGVYNHLVTDRNRIQVKCKVNIKASCTSQTDRDENAMTVFQSNRPINGKVCAASKKRPRIYPKKCRPIGSLQCYCCGQVFTIEKHLEEHVSSGASMLKSPPACQFCGIVFTLPCGVHKHMVYGQCPALVKQTA